MGAIVIAIGLGLGCIYFWQVHCHYQQQLSRSKTTQQSLEAQRDELARSLAALQKEQSALLENRDERLHTILENMPVLLNAFDEEGILKLWNAESERVTGYHAEEMIDNPRAMSWLYPSELYRSDMMQLWQSRGNDFRNWEWDMTCKDGSVKTIAWSNISAQHPIRGWSTWAIGVDVSDRKQATEALQAAKDAAETANQAKSRFLANMSHELRTPLSSILGFSQLMAETQREGAAIQGAAMQETAIQEAATEETQALQPKLSSQQQEYLNIINRSGQDLLGLINDVLEVSKIEAGRITLNLVPFDLRKLTQHLEETLSLQAQVKGLEFNLEIAPGTPVYLQADEGKLLQILLNLAGNAIKFTETGQVAIRISAKSSSVPTAEGEASPSPSSPDRLTLQPLALSFEIEDSGPGIATAELAALFRPFSQSQTGQHAKGTGLGLFISKRFIQLMKGTLSVESQVGKGTTFTCEIPVQETHSIHIAPGNRINRRIRALAPGQQQYRILLAEDRPMNRLLLLQILTPLGFEVWQAEQGQEAVEMCTRLIPDLVLMDMRMPVMDGYEATEKIQQFFEQHSDLSCPKIIALTASAFEEDRRQMMALGCDDFIRKPFNKETFLMLIGKHLGVQYLYEENQQDPEPPEQPPALKTFAVEDLPPDWRRAVHYAAAQGSDRKLSALISQLPTQHNALAAALTDLVAQYRFDRVMELIQSGSSPNQLSGKSSGGPFNEPGVRS